MSQTERKIHLNRAGQSLGYFTLEEIRSGLIAGRYVTSDLGWETGMENWRPLSAWPEFSPSPESISTPPQLPEVVLAGPEIAGISEVGPAWEHRDQVGWLQALFITVKEALLEPATTFERMKRDGGFIAPLLFYMITGMVGGIFALGYQYAFNALDPAEISHLPPQFQQFMKPGDFSPGYLIGMLIGTFIFAPIMLAFISFVWAGITHICLMLLGAANQPFEVTYRVCCYAWGSSRMLAILPVCGSLAGAIWGLVAASIGLAKVHQIETWRAVLAILLPALLCCGLAVAFVATIVAVMAQGMSS